MIPGLTEDQKLYLQKYYEMQIKCANNAWKMYEFRGNLGSLKLMFERRAKAELIRSLGNCNASHLEELMDECYIKGLDVMIDVEKEWRNG